MNRPLIVAAVGAVVVVAALGLTWLTSGGEGLPDAPPPVTTAESASEEPASTSDAGLASGGAPATLAEDEEHGTDVNITSKKTSPSFDVVRVDRKGNAVMAGRSVPGGEVIIRDGEKELGRVRVDDRGEWVFLPHEPLTPGARELRLSTLDAEGIETPSEGSVVLVVPEAGNDPDRPVLAVETAPGRPSRVLQAPTPVLTDAGGADSGAKVVIDVVDYDSEGNLAFGGRAAPGADVLAYVDNEFLRDAVTGDDGRWSVTADAPIPTGQHTLRVDVLGAERDEVIARAEIPFVRPERGDMPAGANDRVVVQPGNSLWRIARNRLGAGAAYTVIYEANRTQIRDPDLIYPGQVFVIPGDDGRTQPRR